MIMYWAKIENDMRKESVRIAYAMCEFLLLSVLSLVPSAVVYLDVVVIRHSVYELSFTEIIQETLLLISALIFWYGSRRHPNRRGFLVLVAGFFSCALIREMDRFLDAIWHGFWIWPAIVVALVSITYVTTRCRNSVAGPVSRFINTRPYFFIMFGLIVLVVFSRTFGSGTLIWKDLIGTTYTSEFKSALQEGIELLGYLFIIYGVSIFWIKDFDS